MLMKTMFLILVLAFFGSVAVGNEADVTFATDSSVVTVDDIRFEVERFHIDPTTNMATVELQLSSLRENPRELKINSYGTQLVDNNRDAYYFSTITLGRVLVRFEDKQNYMHYLLQPDAPVKLTITAENIASTADSIQVVKIVFEDSMEEGRFLDVYLSN